VSQAIYVVAKLGVADLLADGPRPVDELAAATKSDPAALRRVLRALASLGIFADRDEQGFDLTSAGQHLRSDVAGSLRGIAILQGEPWNWQPWGAFLETVRSGQSAFEQIYGKDRFRYLGENPEAAAVFSTGLDGRVDVDASILAAYDFSGVRSVVDVGAGYGSLVIRLLQAYPGMHGVIYDLPPVAPGAAERVQQAGIGDRCRVIPGDFFASVPGGGDLYILRKVVHDWDDRRPSAILRSCRGAMPMGGLLMLIETVIDASDAAAINAVSDLQMLAVTPGGRERTADEFRSLLRGAGFALSEIVPTPLDHSLIVATAV
jgi:hypothetical protein